MTAHCQNQNPCPCPNRCLSPCKFPSTCNNRRNNSSGCSDRPAENPGIGKPSHNPYRWDLRPRCPGTRAPGYSNPPLCSGPNKRRPPNQNPSHCQNQNQNPSPSRYQNQNPSLCNWNSTCRYTPTNSARLPPCKKARPARTKNNRRGPGTCTCPHK